MTTAIVHLMTWPRRLGPSLLVLGLTACDAPLDPEALALRDEPIEIAELPGPHWSGVWPPPGGTFNTAWLGDDPLMRLMPPGVEWAPRSGDGLIDRIEVLDGDAYVPVTHVSVPQGMLVLTTEEGTYDGEDVVGSRWWLEGEDQQYVTITEVSQVGSAFGYQLEHRHGDLVDLVCAPSIDGDHWAYLVEDVFVDVDDGSITPDDGPLLVACASGALGKAITWGFTPWYPNDDTLSLYRTGVRTVRADYCGDGSSYTEEGTLIQVRNELAGLSFVAPEQSTEAVFGPDGALCLSEPRVPSRRMVACTLGPCEEGGSLPSAKHQAWTKLAPPPP